MLVRKTQNSIDRLFVWSWTIAAPNPLIKQVLEVAMINVTIPIIPNSAGSRIRAIIMPTTNRKPCSENRPRNDQTKPLAACVPNWELFFGSDNSNQTSSILIRNRKHGDLMSIWNPLNGIAKKRNPFFIPLFWVWRVFIATGKFQKLIVMLSVQVTSKDIRNFFLNSRVGTLLKLQ